jgi:hypothetical protein
MVEQRKTYDLLVLSFEFILLSAHGFLSDQHWWE